MKLKLRFPVTSIVQVILCALLSGLAVFTFSKSSFYHYFQTFVIQISQALATLTHLTVAIQIIPLMLLILILWGIYASTRGSKQFTTFLILLCVPAILSFSSYNWLELVGIPIETSLRLQEMLIIAGAITIGHISFFYLNHFKENKSDLLKRGGSEDEINECHLKGNAFSFILILLALLIATAVLAGSMLLRGAMAELTAVIPMRMFVIGIGASLTVIAAVYVLIIKWAT